MLKYLGLASLMLIIVGCASTADKAEQVGVDHEALKTQWEMEGRSPEWKVTIDDRRFHGSFPGRYEGRMMGWNVTEKESKTYLESENKLANIELTKSDCTVAAKDYTHSAIVKINKQTFKGCAKHRA